MFNRHDDSDDEPEHTASPTHQILTGLQLYGHHPGPDEPDTRPMPQTDELDGVIADVFDALILSFRDTGLEPDLPDFLWSAVNLFHRAIDRLQRKLDDNEDAQKRGQKEQDGSEIRSVELETLLAHGQVLLDRRDALEQLRDSAAARYEQQLGTPWRPYTGSMVNHRALTAAVIDSRDFLNAKRRAETEVLLPTGPRIAFTGGTDCNDHDAIWTALDKVRAKHAGMVLLHGGSPTGAERIAVCWADNRKVAHIPFRPDWNRHAKAAPFKRNDALLAAMPIGLLAFPGSGISANLCDKAKRMGIPVWHFGEGGA